MNRPALYDTILTAGITLLLSRYNRVYYYSRFLGGIRRFSEASNRLGSTV